MLGRTGCMNRTQKILPFGPCSARALVSRPQGSCDRSNARCYPQPSPGEKLPAFRIPSSPSLPHLPLQHSPPDAHKGEDADSLWHTQGAAFVEPWALRLCEQTCTLYEIMRNLVSEGSRRLGREVRLNKNEEARKLLLPKGWF